MRILNLLVVIILAGYPLAGPVTAQQSGDKRLTLGSADWSPDGSRILFSALLVNADYSDMSMDKWTLFELNMEDKSLRAVDSSVIFASYHPDGNRVAYGKSVNGNWDLYVRDLRSDETPRRLTTEESRENAPSWSPDGNSLAFNSNRDGNVEIYIMQARGSGWRQITHTDTAKSFTPEWAPHGNRIVYYHEIGDRMDQIYMTDDRGSFVQNLTQDREHSYYPGWAGGERLLFTSGDHQIYIMKTDGTERRDIPGAGGYFARLSPDEKWLVLLDNAAEGLYLLNLRTGYKELLAGKAEIAGALGK